MKSKLRGEVEHHETCWEEILQATTAHDVAPCRFSKVRYNLESIPRYRSSRIGTPNCVLGPSNHVLTAKVSVINSFAIGVLRLHSCHRFFLRSI